MTRNAGRFVLVAVCASTLAAAYGCSGSTTDDSAGSSGSAGTHAGTAGAISGGSAGKAGASGTAGHPAGGSSSAGASSGGQPSGGTTAGGTSSGGDAGAVGEAGAAVGGTGGTGGSSLGGSGGNGGQTAPCFVPYGCTTYVCNSTPQGEGGAGGSNEATTAISATGPRGGIAAAGENGLGEDEAYEFTTNDDLVGSSVSLPQGASPRTVSLWVQPTSLGHQETFFNYGAFLSNERFGLLSVTDLDYFVGEGNDVKGAVQLANFSWHHFAVSYDGTTSLQLYVDGQLDVDGTLTAALDTTGTAFAIGHTVGVPGREAFQGKLSDVRVYDRALNATEIGALAKLDGAGANPEALRSSTSGLVFWLPLFGSSEPTQNRCAP